MIRANETAAAYMIEEDAIRDREQPTEHVLIVYKNGCKRRIGVYMDSYAAIVRDVAKGFQ